MQKILLMLIISIISCMPSVAATFSASVSKNYDYEFEKNIINNFNNINNFAQYNQGNEDLFYQRRFLPMYILGKKELFYMEKNLTSNSQNVKIPNVYNLSFTKSNKNTSLLNFAAKSELSKVMKNIYIAEHTLSLSQVSKLYEDAILKFPDRIEILYKYSLYLYAKRDYPKAIAYLNSVKIKDKNFVLASYTLANIYFDMKDYKKSIKNNLDVLRKNPYCSDAYFNIASALEQMREFSLAIEYYQKCLAINSSDTQAQNAVKRLETISNASF